MKNRLFLFTIFAILFSCDKDSSETEPQIDYSPDISFNISGHLFSGESITNIEIVEDGFYFSSDKEIIKSNFSGQIISSFTAESTVLSLAHNAVENALYIGTNSSGLGKLKNNQLSYFTAENSGLPRNVVRQVECDAAGNIWCNTSAHKISGLVKYDGDNFKEYTPNNSGLPENLIDKFRLMDNAIYILSRGVDIGKAGIKFKNNSWNQLFESGGCGPTDMDIDSEGNMFFIEDSREYCGGGMFPDEVLFSFRNKQKNMHREYTETVDYPHLLKADKRGYVWMAKFPSAPNGTLSVFNGSEWYQAPQEFPEDFIYCIEVTDENTIWIGTNNGIYYLMQ